MIITSGGVPIRSNDQPVSYSGSVVEPIERYYYGVLLNQERPSSFSFMNLIRVNETSNKPHLKLTYPYIVGWQVFVEHRSIPKRRFWTDGYNAETPIAGNWNDFNPYLFPEPFEIQHDGHYWWVYLSSYVTLINAITFVQ